MDLAITQVPVWLSILFIISFSTIPVFLINQAVKSAYENGNYSEAIQYFQKVPATDANHTEALFYLGHSYYQNKNYDAATSTFQQVAATKDIRYMEAAEWYQVVNTLAAGKVDANFNVLLNKIADDGGHTYHHNALELRGQLNSFWRKLKF